MSRPGIRLFGIIFVALIITGVGLSKEHGTSAEQASAATTNVPGPRELQPLIHSVEGPNLFRSYCATCHGVDGKGNGPAAAALKSKPADLTALARNNHGQFPLNAVRSTISGEKVLASHGSREMPIWGPVFHQIEADVDRGHVRMENLLKYLESIQTPDENGAKSKSTTTQPFEPGGISGAKLFQQDCAVCHTAGATAPEVPSPFRTPPDLATLAQRHGGKFPEAYVTGVLQNGIEMPAHGPAEMPIWGADFAARDKLDAKQVASRIAMLTDYLKSIQMK